MRISAIQAFGFDFSDEELTRDLAARFPDLTEGTLEIDFSQCLIDYKATSVFMDAALDKLCQVPQPRDLVILFNVKFHERLFLKWLFFGSSRLGLDVGALTDEEIRIKVAQHLGTMHIRLSIKVTSSQGESVAYSLDYGH